MPGPNLNLGKAPHDSDDVQDLWYALEELGFSVGRLQQTDFAFQNDTSVSADGEVSTRLEAPGGEQIQGQAKSSGQYSIQVEWLDPDGNVVRREGVISNREGGTWSNYSLDPKSAFVNIVVVNDTSSQQTVNLTGHYR